MTWLYTLLFAGMVFSSTGDTITDRSNIYSNLNAPTKVVLVDETEKFEQNYPLSANGRVSVSNVNGSITVEAWDRNEVRLEATKVADSKETLQSVEIQIDAKPDHFSVETDYHWNTGRDGGWGRGRKMEVHFKLMVPRGAVLDEIETVNGSVVVSNFTNQTKVSAVNGNVTANNLRGAASLSTVNGTVAADFERLDPASRISLETVNGTVNLALPSDSNATIKADSVNGDIGNDFGLPVRKGKYVGRDMYGKLGTGETQVRLESVNGKLWVARKKDGRSASPAVDLLPKKAADEDDDDWDDDGGSAAKVKVKVDADKLNKHIEKSIKEAEKEIRKDLEKMKPEVDIDVEAIQKAAVESVDVAKIREKARAEMDRQRAEMARARDAVWGGGTPAIERKTNTIPVKGVPKVTIDAKNCDIKVSGWDKQEVRYVVTKVGSSRASSPLSVVDEESKAGITLKVDTSGDSSFGDEDDVRVEVFVPKKSDLKIITDGEIRLDGITGEIDLQGGDEAINVRDSGGRLNLKSGDARVRILGFRGALDAVTGEGELFLEGDFDRISAVSSDGSVVVTLPANGNADIESDVSALRVHNMPAPESSRNGQWRFGSGGAKYKFTVGDGEVTVRNLASVRAN